MANPGIDLTQTMRQFHHFSNATGLKIDDSVLKKFRADLE